MTTKTHISSEYSRQDLSVVEVEQQIRNVKYDHRFPKHWKQIELDYLYSLLRYVS